MLNISAEYLSSSYSNKHEELLHEVYSFVKPEHCFIARLGALDHSISVMEIFSTSYLLNGSVTNNIDYQMIGTPCEFVITLKQAKCISKSVQQLFPLDVELKTLEIEGYLGIPLFDFEGKVIGIFVCLFNKTIRNENELVAYCETALRNAFNRFEIEDKKLAIKYETTRTISSNGSKANLDIVNFAFDHISEAIMITNVDNKIVVVNNAMLKITGYSEEELINQNPRILSSGLQDSNFYQRLWEKLHRNGKWKGELYNKRKNGDIYPEEMSINVIRNEEGSVTHFVALFRDISDAKNLENKLRLYADYEPLTGLLNRRAFNDKLNRVLMISSKTNKEALLFIDLDEFKLINDTYGHEMGDMLLIEVSNRLSKSIDQEDLLCRYGGDEFALLLRVTKTSMTDAILKRIMEVLREPFVKGNITINISASIGVSLCNEMTETLELLLNNASYAMRIAKSRGRNCIVFHDEHLNKAYQRKLNLKEELLKAIKCKKLDVYYQPIIRVESDEITKFEALVRWKNTEGVYMPPSEFIPIAEEFNLIHILGAFVLERACSDLKKIHDIGYPNIVFSINLSTKELIKDGSSNNTILSIIQASGLPFNSIIIEITESTVMSDNTHTKATLSKLRDQGVRIAFDDFCTGYSSLNYLVDYDVDIIKIDRSFVGNISINDKCEILISTVLCLAKKLGIEVVAEGVENENQLEYLRQLRCEYVQGFYFSKAIPFDDISRVVESQCKNSKTATPTL